MMPSKTPLLLRSTTRNMPTVLPFSIFCHSPAAVGSADRAGATAASAIARTVTIGSISRSTDIPFRIVITLTNRTKIMLADYGDFAGGTSGAMRRARGISPCHAHHSGRIS